MYTDDGRVLEGVDKTIVETPAWPYMPLGKSTLNPREQPNDRVLRRHPFGGARCLPSARPVDDSVSIVPETIRE